MTTRHPLHRIELSAPERRNLQTIEESLGHQFPGIPAGRIIRMVQGTARLLRTAGATPEQLAEQVESSCRAALHHDIPTHRPFASEYTTL